MAKNDDELEGLKDLSDTAEGYSRSTVLYGRSGTGKTTLASTWPKPMLYLDVRDRGIDSISNVKGIDLKEIDSFEDLEETLFWLIRHPKKYKTVVIDTLSQVQELLVEEIGSKRQKKKSSSAKRAGDWGVLRQQDWGEIASKMKSIIIDFRNLPMEVVFIAQDRTSKGSEDDDADDSDAEAIMPEVGPQLMPSVAKVLNAAVSVIGNSFIRLYWVKEDNKGKKIRKPVKAYCLRVGPSATFTTKVRKPREIVAPDFLEDASYDDIVDIISGDYEE
jgi:AAA domain-containing protein